MFIGHACNITLHCMKLRKFTLNDPPIGADFGSKPGGIWAPDHFCSVVGGL